MPPLHIVAQQMFYASDGMPQVFFAVRGGLFRSGSSIARKPPKPSRALGYYRPAAHRRMTPLEKRTLRRQPALART